MALKVSPRNFAKPQEKKQVHTQTHTELHSDLLALSSPSFPCTSLVTSAASRLCARRLLGSSLCCSIRCSTSVSGRKVNNFRYLQHVHTSASTYSPHYTILVMQDKTSFQKKNFKILIFNDITELHLPLYTGIRLPEEELVQFKRSSLVPVQPHCVAGSFAQLVSDRAGHQRDG